MTMQERIVTEPNQTPVIDYEGSKYETDFWVGQGRDYEDATERLALRRLIPAKGGRIAEIGAAYGRLVDLYQGYEQIILVDYSRSQLQTAAQRLGKDARYVFIAGNVYNLPLASGVLDTLVMVRVMHHLANVPNALSELARLLHPQSTAVIEYANKRNVKAFLRWWMYQQNWSPNTLEPVEFVKLNFDFHPTWMNRCFAEAGFTHQQQFAVSHFRMAFLKRLFSAATLAQLDSYLFSLCGTYPLSPSVFVQSTLPGAAQRTNPLPTPVSTTNVANITQLLRCTTCQNSQLVLIQEDILQCKSCQTRYNKKLGVWDFKEVEPGIENP